jgi:hypothetical protein
MPAKVTPAKFQSVLKHGFERINMYRKARAMFMKQFAGQYYRSTKGQTGDEPLNLMFKTLSAFIPALVTSNPINEVTSKYLVHKPYTEMLGLALDQIDKDLKLKEVLRGWIASAFFAFGIIKVSLSSAECMIQYGDQLIDPGQVYAELVDLDDFVFDPICNSFQKASFLGSRTRVPRQILLDTEGYDHDMVMKLPVSRFNETSRVDNMTKQGSAASEVYTLQDYVDVVESWVPEAQAMVTTPDPRQIILPKYLRVEDYYGPADGPFTFLSFTPPIQGNPLPIAPVANVHDLHKIANRTFKRMMEQADREKDVLAYQPSAADEAQDMVDAEDGDTVAVTDPDAMRVMSWGGASQKNQEMTQQFHTWFNYMAGDPDTVAGQDSSGGGRETATKASIKQSNSALGIQDARGIISDQTAEVNKKMAWYLHNDPLINLPLIKRSTGGEYQQLTLTPEQRQGDFWNFNFSLRAKSLAPVDPQQRARLMTEFAVSIMPAVMQAAMVSMQMGVPFNVQRCLTQLAEAQGLTQDVQAWFDDPEFNQKMQIMMKMGPQNPGKAGQSGQQQSGQGFSTPPKMADSQQQQTNMDQQATAGEAQQTF